MTKVFSVSNDALFFFLILPRSPLYVFFSVIKGTTLGTVAMQMHLLFVNIQNLTHFLLYTDYVGSSHDSKSSNR